MKVEQLGHPLDQIMETGLQQTGLQQTGLQQQIHLGGGSESRALEGKKRRSDPGRHNKCSVEDELELSHKQSGSWEEHVTMTSVMREVTTTNVPLFTLPNHFHHLTINALEQDSRHKPRRTAATDMEQNNTTYTELQLL